MKVFFSWQFRYGERGSESMKGEDYEDKESMLEENDFYNETSLSQENMTD